MVELVGRESKGAPTWPMTGVEKKKKQFGRDSDSDWKSAPSDRPSCDIFPMVD